MRDINWISTKDMLAWQAEDMVKMLDAWVQGRIVPNTIVSKLHCNETVRVVVGISRIDLCDEADQYWGFPENDESKTHLQAIFQLGDDEYGTEEDIAESIDEVVEVLLENDMGFDRNMQDADLRSFKMKMGWLCRYYEIEIHDWDEWGQDCIDSAIELCVIAWNESICEEKIQELVCSYATELIHDPDNIQDEDVYRFCCKIIDVDDNAFEWESKLEFIRQALGDGFIDIDEDDEVFKDLDEEEDEIKEWRMEVLKLVKGD